MQAKTSKQQTLPPKFISLDDVLKLIDSDEFYDLLPGNGEDDRICGWLEKQVKKLKSVELVKL